MNLQPIRIVGLDLSISSTGICVMDIDCEFNISSIKLYGFTKTNKWEFRGDNLSVYKVPKEYGSYPSYYKPIVVYNLVKEHIEGVTHVAVEDYAYNGNGKVFELAEYSGVMKNVFYSMNIPIKKIPPAIVKQFATGNGNANKILMRNAFVKSGFENIVDRHLFNLQDHSNPQEDLIDSCYIADILRVEMCYSCLKKIPKATYTPHEYIQKVLLKFENSSKTKLSIES